MAIVFIFNQQDYKDKLERGYKVHVEREERNKKPYTRRTDFMNPVIKPNAKIINYWCFNPGFAMTLLLGTQIRSIILTSGTLGYFLLFNYNSIDLKHQQFSAPLQALISELSIPVGQRLENPHIIDNSQVCVKVVSSGPDGELLDSSFKNRENPKYLDSLGRTILSFCNLIPHGLLVFFPSYPMMNKSVEHWKKTGEIN